MFAFPSTLEQQIRMAVGADSLADPRYLGAVIDIAMRGLPHAYRETRGETGQTVMVDVSGPSGGQWTLSSDGPGWNLYRGEPASSTARIRLTDDTTWKLLFNALSEDDADAKVQIEGPAELGRAFLRARSVIV